MSAYLTQFIFTLVAAVVITYIVRTISRSVGFVSIPKGDRWNQRVVSLGGGVAIISAAVMGFLFLKDNGMVISILPAIIGIFLVGLIDDIWGVSPSGKLIFQAIAASYVVGKGFVLPIPFAVPAIALSVIWIVGMTNSLNLIDNMDGLAAGVSFIACLAFAFIFHSLHQPLLAMTAVTFAASCLGFLVFNFQPARIFMGDAGSLPLGFVLATLSTKLLFGSSDIPGFLTLVPVLFLLVVPVFDTTLVMTARRSAKRPITTGGRDHTSHRLVALGLSERKAVSFLYLVALVGGAVAYYSFHANGFELILIAIAFSISMTLFGIFLLEIAVYPAPVENTSSGASKPRPPGFLPLTLLYLVEIALDVCAISFAWLLAHQVRFYDTGLTAYFKGFSVIPFLPYVLTCKLFACSIFRLYRGLWRSIWVKDIYQVFKAATLGTLLLVGGLALTTRLVDLSRVVIIVDWLLTFVALLGTRTALIAFRRWFRKISSSPYKAAFLGSAELLPLVREATELETGIDFEGIVPTASSNYKDIEQFVLEKGIDILIVANDKHDDTLSFLATRGVTIRHLKVHFS